MSRELDQLAHMRNKADERYGHKTGFIARDVQFDWNVLPTGWMGLDYMLGIGGWPLGHSIEVFGINDIGKSSLIAFNAVKSAHAKGLLVGWIALEPSTFSTPSSIAWAEKHGLDLDRTLVAYPNNGEKAFELLTDWTTGRDTNGKPVLSYIIFDSIGAVMRAGEAEQGTPSAYGAANLISSGTKAQLIPCLKNNVGIMYLNQVRHGKSGNPNITLFDSPGGEALKHHCMTRIQLRPGGRSFTEKVNGVEMEIGRPLMAVEKRNKLAEGTSKKAYCDYYFADVDGYPFGIDHIKDMIDTAKTAGVMQGAGWLEHHTFPENKSGEHKLNGKKAVENYWKEHPESEAAVRKEVLDVMNRKVAEAEAEKRATKHLEAVK